VVVTAGCARAGRARSGRAFRRPTNARAPSRSKISSDSRPARTASGTSGTRLAEPPSVGAQQSPQKRCCGWRGAPQTGQPASWRPHVVQNFCPSGFSVRQPVHRILGALTPCGSRRSDRRQPLSTGPALTLPDRSDFRSLRDVTERERCESTSCREAGAWLSLARPACGTTLLPRSRLRRVRSGPTALHGRASAVRHTDGRPHCLTGLNRRARWR